MTKPTLIALVVLGLTATALAAAAAFVYSGAYDIAADEPHWPVTSRLMAIVRERSIAARTGGIEVPADLADPERARRGAGNYDAMCAGCHLKPRQRDSEIRQGLYPQPPNLTLNPEWHGHEHEHAGDPAAAVRQFWIIKHGIKMTAMPAWAQGGVDDRTIWDLVAFLQKLPAMSPQTYAALVESSEGHSHAGAEGHDGHGGGEPAGHVDPPGAPPHHHGKPKAPDSHDHSH